VTANVTTNVTTNATTNATTNVYELVFFREQSLLLALRRHFNAVLLFEDGFF
jgi:hypothetical protein